MTNAEIEAKIRDLSDEDRQAVEERLNRDVKDAEEVSEGGDRFAPPLE